MRLYNIYLILLFSFTASVVCAQEPFRISQLDRAKNLDSYTVFYIDVNNSLRRQNLLQTDFKPLKKGNFGVTKSAVWTRVVINNDTPKAQNIVLFNPLASMDEIDVYVIKNDALQASYLIGDTRPLENNLLKYRLGGVPLDIDPNETLEVISRNYHPTGTMIAQWQIRNQSEFIHFLSLEMVFWGIFIGIVIALIIYNMGLFFALRNSFFVFYSLLAMMSLMFQLSMNGLFYMFQIKADLGPSAIYGLQVGIFLLLFGITFFEKVARDYRYLTKFIYGSIGITFFWLVLTVLQYPSVTVLAKGALFIALVNFILSTVIAFIGLYNRYEGAYSFFAGQAFILIAYFYQLFVRIGFIDTYFISTYVVAVCSFFDVLFLSVAISQKIKKIETDRQNNAKMITIQSQFAMMGKTASNILHQWRQPITHIGTLTMFIESVIRDGKDETAERLRSVIPKLYTTIDFMSQTVLEMNAFFTSDSNRSEFVLKSEVLHVLELLQEKIKLNAVLVETRIEEDIMPFQLKSALNNTLMAIIDNAVDMIRLYGIQNGMITIVGFKKGENVIIEISDNAGGIRIKPIDAVFDPFISSKENSSGLGLPIVKVLVEEKLGGNIRIKNQNGGALFRIAFPYREVINK